MGGQRVYLKRPLPNRFTMQLEEVRPGQTQSLAPFIPAKPPSASQIDNYLDLLSFYKLSVQCFDLIYQFCSVHLVSIKQLHYTNVFPFKIMIFVKTNQLYDYF